MSKVQLLSGLGNKPRYQTGKNVLLVKKKKSKVDVLAKKVNRITKAIPMNFVTQNIGTTIDLGGTVYNPNGLTLGTTYNTREGLQISMKRFKCTFNFVATDTYNYLRVILVYSKENRGTNLSIVDLLRTVGNPINSQYALEYRKRYKILKDFVVYSESAAGSGKQSVYRKFSVNLKGMITRYNTGNAGTYADIDKGLLSLVFISDSGVATHPGISINYELSYTP